MTVTKNQLTTLQKYPDVTKILRLKKFSEFRSSS